MNRSKTMFILGLAFVVIAMPLLCGSAADAQKKTVKIGFAGALSGASAPWGMSLLNAIRYYADKANSAGGMKLGNDQVLFEIFAEDDKWVASECVAAVTKLIHVNRIDYLFLASGTGSMAVKEIVTQNKVPAFSGGWAKFLGPAYPYMFRHIMDEYAAMLAMISYVKKNNPNIKTVAILNADNDTGRGSTKASMAAWKAVGVEVVGTEHYEVGTIDFFPVVTKLLSKKPDFIDPSSTPPADYSLMYKAARDLGYTGGFVSGGMPEDPLEGTITVGIVPGDPRETPAQREYREAYLAKHKTLHSWWEFYAAGPYALFTSFLPDAKSGNPDVVYKTITAPGYRFRTWWGPSYWFGKDVAMWGIDRQIAAPIPMKKAIGGKWVQLEYLEPENYIPLYKTLKE